jgi:beta-galactosidase/beta-glucuronidase
MKIGKKRAPAPADLGYPRPQMQRERWISLNGSWDCAIDAEDRIERPDGVKWDRTIQVPFAPETPLSGVGETGLHEAVWYRREFDAPGLEPGQRLLLHFGAVDYEATVWVNGKLAVRHEGGYTPFCADVTELLNESGSQVLVVRAQDDPADLAKPRGKQDWQAQPHSIWYYRTTGIWQTVWLEVVSETYLSNIRWDPNAQPWEIGIEVRLGGRRRHDLVLHVTLSQDSRVLADDEYSFNSDELARRIAIPDPGIDDFRNQMLWSPESPKLIDAVLELKDSNGKVLDRVSSYTAIRSMALLGDRFVLNGKPYRLYLALDQGYWADGGMTAPNDEAYRRDVELAKAMGFNGVRMHQKIENPRFLYWADRLGLLVWGEMPSAYRFTDQAAQRLICQWIEAIKRDISHPCIMAWVPFNESWGVPDLPDSRAQRNLVQALYHLTKTLDRTRPVIGNDGWEAVATDIVTIHDYDPDPQRIERRYAGTMENIPNLLRAERPGHKLLAMAEFQYQQQPIMLTEFGGIAFSKDRSRTWGYSRVEDAREFAGMYYRLCSAARSSTLLAGFCYTQFADTYQEANGLLYMDRTPKIPLEQIAIGTRGERSPKDFEISAGWRGAVMGNQNRNRSGKKARARR